MDIKREHRILFCECAETSALSAQATQDVRLALAEAGLCYDAVRDLCGLAAAKDPLLAEVANASCLTIAACHPRAVRWLFAAGGASLPEEGVTYLDMREDIPAESLQSLRAMGSELGASGDAGHTPATAVPPRATETPSATSVLPHAIEPPSATAEAAPGAPPWTPWFPVIDYGRCENCQQCMGFCLFGVYGVAPDGTVLVAHAAKCKTGCPACARMCPSAAIIFPKYANAPINGGEVKEGATLIEPVKVDKVTLLRGDVLKTLQNRGKGALPSPQEMDQVRAVQERMLRLAGQHDGHPLSFGRVKPDPPEEKPT
jgi:NAD-dependent dihydropyrimidine dehydrogenase PreA subunit